MTGISSGLLVAVSRRAEDGEELTKDEEHQYFVYLVANLRDWENIHYQYRHGMFDDNEFEAEKTAWQFVTGKNKAFGRSWCRIRHNFSPEFVTELEGLLYEDVCVTTQNE